MNLGSAIQLCRVKQGLSQSALAEKANCSVSYLSMLENSKRDPTLSTIKSIAGALGVPIEILFFLGADEGELAGINKDLAGQLADTALNLLNTRHDE
ncbi:XRE family transcriptional regulator [Herbaspirillum huttiense]|uniref:XRE family transcription regulator protein n=2 Tax=Herbaspirillum seropedicae TaxID=964 RepID=D8IZQ4_HERSS|nr:MULTISPECIES: helix-turn-helix transcriptional regulator [Herbaspirillum]ADJ64394.1 XRE family transcription regulator protein [Herbaspirillum seropedicae SmR1]AKN66326.1 DNA-binding protein [Herbaspirillum seropedicae]NQE30568.1 DNA-binding protein [Herbaspirillum seropedicae]QBP76222.1 XRE family transcriptional regulator [Herbaspirillum huttiense]UMU24272.1 helix-turn-helix transcriptional regulator [Herbaspirillum seropedicae]